MYYERQYTQDIFVRTLSSQSQLDFIQFHYFKHIHHDITKIILLIQNVDTLNGQELEKNVMNRPGDGLIQTLQRTMDKNINPFGNHTNIDAVSR